MRWCHIKALDSMTRHWTWNIPIIGPVSQILGLEEGCVGDGRRAACKAQCLQRDLGKVLMGTVACLERGPIADARGRCQDAAHGGNVHCACCCMCSHVAVLVFVYTYNVIQNKCI